MRKWNAVLTAVTVLLFLLHALLGGLLMASGGGVILKPLARAAATLVLLHTGIGIKLTVDSLRVWKQTGVSYFRENKLFWARRVSGLAVMALLFLHMAVFMRTGGVLFGVVPFTAPRLAGQLLFVAALAVHLITNIRPMVISLGIRALRKRVGGILFALSVLLLFLAAAFILYYLRWHI